MTRERFMAIMNNYVIYLNTKVFKNPVQARLSVFSDGIDIVVIVMRFSYFFTVKYVSNEEEKEFELYLKVLTEKILKKVMESIKKELFMEHNGFNIKSTMN